MLDRTKEEFMKIKEEYAPYITDEMFMHIYKRWRNDSKRLEFIKYLQTWMEINEIESPPIILQVVK